MNKKCCFIIPYFGKFPNYFQLFLNSCRYNEDYNWLIFTDDTYEYNVPKNVEIIYITFENLKAKIQSKFEFMIELDAPYKLCDYRPAYGYVFEEYLKDFSFWGFCDTDILIGDINKFISLSDLNSYDKFFCLGHFALIKNTFENNRLFMSEMDNEKWYYEIFTTKKNMIFDENCRSEKNFHKIFLSHNKNVLEEDYSINFKILPTRFVKIKFNPKKGDFFEDNRSAVYIWSKGHLYRYVQETKVEREEYLYIHLQERKMKIDKKIDNKSDIQIIPNKFLEFTYDHVDIDNFNKIKKSGFSIHYLQYHYKWKKKRIIEIFNSIKRKNNEKQ